MFRRLKSFFLRLFAYESSPHKLAIAFACAVYVSFSPFIGLHTIMLVCSGWLFKTSIPLIVMLGYVINNPFTMVPIVMSGYFFGYWFLKIFCQGSLLNANPWWMEMVSSYVQKTLLVPHLSLWAFMIGANILGLLLALVSYGILRVFFERSAKNKTVIRENERKLL